MEEERISQLGKSETVIEQNIKSLKQLFPQVFTEDKINFSLLEDLLGEKIEDKKEYYELSWAGKSDARKELSRSTTATLTPIREKSVDFDTTQNLFIEGENLEVLRTLQKSYFGKIKMIYIDPPYNTGSDSFVYPDNYSETKKEYEKRIGKVDEEGYINKVELWKQNSKENGQYHSVWLSMMYSRLSYAHSLLSEDGVIFISIDENEQANLKLLCDSVFGENNFVSQFIWQKNFAPKNDNKYISFSHEYILLYSKNKELFKRNLLPRTDTNNEGYNNPDNDYRGIWASGTMLATTFSQLGVYPIVSPNGKEHFPPNGRCWRYSKSRLHELISDNRIWFGINGDGVPRVKRFLSEMPNGIVPQTILKYEDVGSAQEGTLNAKRVFDNSLIFDFPKPIKLIKRFIHISTKNNDIILDFFAGSCTTGHAVMELNKEDGGNRKFICIQMPEKTDKKSEAYKQGYEKISDIGAERLRRAGNRIKEEIEKTRNENIENKDIDTGFKYYRLTPSHFKVWQNDINENELGKQLDAFIDATKEGSVEEEMLYELILKSGFSLTTPIEKNGKGFYYIKEWQTCIALENFNKEIIETIFELKPKEVITLDKFFENNDSLLSNTRLEFKDKEIILTII